MIYPLDVRIRFSYSVSPLSYFNLESNLELNSCENSLVVSNVHVYDRTLINFHVFNF